MEDEPPVDSDDTKDSEDSAVVVAPNAMSPGAALLKPLPERSKADPPEKHRHLKRLRRLAGRKAPYTGPIVAISRGWVSRDGDWHVFAARFLDFAMLTDEHLLFFSTGFFTRRPRRRVFREPLGQLVVVARGKEPIQTVRVEGDFNRALLVELPSDTNSLAFIEELLRRTRTDRRALELPPRDKQDELTAGSKQGEITAAPKPRELTAGSEPSVDIEPSGEQTSGS